MAIPFNTFSIPPSDVQNGTKIAGRNNHLSINTVPSEAKPQSGSLPDPLLSIANLPQERLLAPDERTELIEQMKSFISAINTKLSFRVDSESGRDVVTIYDTSTGEMIRQIPDEEMLDVFRHLKEQVTQYYAGGILTDKI